ncbi:prepilin peptidase [Desulfohalovibrio reitneri]|uniref:prepilin peptidase n=1 Tax=Desulfohalovibrio reitneri TaxID=1307759 RepID=UPI00068B97B8|nr:prepilin peptidase [Desulfohalovibrio reitneri]
MDAFPLISCLLGLGLGVRADKAAARLRPDSPRPSPLRLAATVLTMGLWAWLAAERYGFSAHWGAALLFGWLLLTVSSVDLACFRIPDALSLPGAALALPAGAFLYGLGWDAVIGALAGAGFLLAAQQGHRLLTGGREGLGGGDVKLMLLIGGLLGWRLLPLVLLLACAAALPASILYLGRRRADGDHLAVPFGPFLALGAGVCLLYGPALWRAWLRGGNGFSP